MAFSQQSHVSVSAWLHIWVSFCWAWGTDPTEGSFGRHAGSTTAHKRQVKYGESPEPITGCRRKERKRGEMGLVWNRGALKALPLAGGAAGSREGPKCWSCTGDVGWVEGGDEQLIGCSCARGIHVGCSASGNSQQVLEKVTAWSVGYELDSLLLKKGFFGTG